MTVYPNYSLLVTSGFKFQLANIGKNPIFDQQKLIKSSFHDVVVTRPRSSLHMHDVYTNALFTVNGFIHKSVYYADKLYIKGAGKALTSSKYNHLGIINFTELTEELDIIPITKEMIQRNKEYSLYTRCEIDLNKEVDGLFLVLAGYLIRLDDLVLKLLGPQLASLQISKLSFIEMIYELSRYMPIFEQLGVEVADTNDKLVDRNHLLSDEVIEKLLTHDNTFFVNIPGKFITYEEKYLEYTTIPGPFRVGEEPTYPLVGGYGKFIEYLPRNTNDSRWIIQTVDPTYDRLIQEYGPRSVKSSLVSDQRLVGNTYGISNAYLLRMGVEDI